MWSPDPSTTERSLLTKPPVRVCGRGLRRDQNASAPREPDLREHVLDRARILSPGLLLSQEIESEGPLLSAASDASLDEDREEISKAEELPPVSYTHLTLPTIYSV